MFSAGTSFKSMAACAVLMMMIMMMTMTDAAAVVKGMKTVSLLLDPSTLVPSKTHRPLENSSISPWTYNDTMDPSLLTQLSEARCLLRGCLNSKGQEDLRLESKPIMHQVLVLRRVKPDGVGVGVGVRAGAAHNYHYRLESRLIAVGCTCIQPVVQVQN